MYTYLHFIIHYFEYMDTEFSSPKKRFPLIWVGVAIICIVVVGVGIWVFQSYTGGRLLDTFQSREDQNDTSTIAPPSEEEIRAQYVDSLDNIAGEIEKMSVANPVELVGVVEEKLMDVRVPGERRDVFIRTFLAIGKLKNASETQDTIKIKILELINSLRASA